jgi:hypothetical protein
MKIEMGIGWVPSEEKPGQVRSATPTEYAAEIERLKKVEKAASQVVDECGPNMSPSPGSMAALADALHSAWRARYPGDPEALHDAIEAEARGHRP